MAGVAPLPDGEISLSQALAASVEKTTIRSAIVSTLLSHMMDLISNHQGRSVKCLIKAAFSGTGRYTNANLSRLWASCNVSRSAGLIGLSWFVSVAKLHLGRNMCGVCLTLSDKITWLGLKGGWWWQLFSNATTLTVLLLKRKPLRKPNLISYQCTSSCRCHSINPKIWQNDEFKLTFRQQTEMTEGLIYRSTRRIPVLGCVLAPACKIQNWETTQHIKNKQTFFM